MVDLVKSVVLTGASRGIGHATVKRFSEAGWRIITCSREGIPDDCRRDPNWAHHIKTDLAESKSVNAFIEKANTIIGEGGLHALVNNAAQSPKTPYKERLGSLNGSLEDWREVYDLNLFRAVDISARFCRRPP